MELMVTVEKRDIYQGFAERLIAAWQEEKKKPEANTPGFTRALGALAGIGYKGAEKWVKGDAMPDMGNAALLAKGLNVSFEWLMTGRGPMHPAGNRYPPVIHKAAESAPTDYARTPQEQESREIAQAIANLTPKLRAAVKRLVDDLAKP